jgi:hydrogenase/urease accessory protein HupE
MRIRHFLIALMFLAAPLLRGHQVDTLEFEFQKLDEQWRLVGEMDIAYMLPETRKVPGGQPLSREATMKAAPEELARIRKETENTLRKLMRVTWAGNDVPFRIEFPDFDKTPFELPPEAADWALLTTRVLVDRQSGAGDLVFHWSSEEEAELIVLTEDSEDGVPVSVQPGGYITLVRQQESGTPVIVPQAAKESWIRSGFRHVLPLGLDHMLFIIGLFLMVPKWKPLLGQSLLFTIAHSTTLALAVLGWVNLPGRLVEILIAFSIAFIGVENLLTQKVGRLRLVLVFAFGLIHGLGFASVLADKLGGIPRDQLAWPLLGFNVGVELAQITVLAISFLVLWPLKKWERTAQTVGSVIVTLSGLGWMIERMFFS